MVGSIRGGIEPTKSGPIVHSYIRESALLIVCVVACIVGLALNTTRVYAMYELDLIASGGKGANTIALRGQSRSGPVKVAEPTRGRDNQGLQQSSEDPNY